VASIWLIQIPYDSGRFNERMGRGPQALIERGLVDDLKRSGHEVTLKPIRLPDGFYTEGNDLVELQRLTVPVVRAALDAKARPILLSGNCGTAAASAMSALGAKDTGVFWFDAHADFNTPDTSPSGFLDGMALTLLTGYCWPKLSERLESFQPTPENQVFQIGVRETDPGEESRLSKSRITRIAASDISKMSEGLSKLTVRQLYVHVDVDVIDPSEGSANSYACPGGLSINQLSDALELIAKTARIAAGSVTAYDPAIDRDGRIGRAIPRLVKLLAS
jgi:arginase